MVKIKAFTIGSKNLGARAPPPPCPTQLPPMMNIVHSKVKYREVWTMQYTTSTCTAFSFLVVIQTLNQSTFSGFSPKC